MMVLCFWSSKSSKTCSKIQNAMLAIYHWLNRPWPIVVSPWIDSHKGKTPLPQRIKDGFWHSAALFSVEFIWIFKMFLRNTWWSERSSLGFWIHNITGNGSSSTSITSSGHVCMKYILPCYYKVANSTKANHRSIYWPVHVFMALLDCSWAEVA